MNKHFLVTISNDHDNLTGIEFICSFFKQLSEHQLTLLHICRLDAQNMNKTLLEAWDNPDERVKGQLTIGAKKALDKSISMLNNSNMSVDQMITKTFGERYGKVKDIILEASKGLYDAVILGKRSSYTLQWVFERPAEETPNLLVSDAALRTPIWICPQPEIGRKNVLVGVDGSDASYRAVDHVGYILSKQDQHTLTLIHVENGAQLNTEEIFTKAGTILSEHNIAPERIAQTKTWGINVASTLYSYAEKHGFAAIAVGLKGVEQGFFKSVHLSGGASASLIKKAEKISLWCCP